MPVTINGTTGVVTPNVDATSANAGTLTVGSITGLLKASSGVVSQANVGTDYSQLTLATAQTASGTSVDFTGIPSWVKRITVMFSEISTTGSSNYLLRVGSGSFLTSGYVSSATSTSSSGTQGGTLTTGIALTIVQIASSSISGIAVINNINSNNWVSSSILTRADAVSFTGSGISPSLSGALDRIRITTVNGTDTFDAGTINISYE
jgi:hypothetical protein